MGRWRGQQPHKATHDQTLPAAARSGHCRQLFFFAARPNLAAASWTWLSHGLELGGGVGWEKEGGRREGMEEIRNVNSFVWEMGIHMYMLTFVDYLLNNKLSRFV